MKGRLEELAAAARCSKEDAAELDALEKEVAEATAAHDKVRADAAGIRAECARLQEEMDNVGGEKLKKQRATVKELAAGIAAAEDAVTEKRATAASHAKATARLIKAIEEATAEREKLTEDVKTIKEEFKALEDGALAVLESQKELQALCDDKAAELAEASRARDDALKVVGTIKHVEVDIQAKLDDLGAATEENEGKVAHWGAELEKLRKEQETLAAESGAEEPVPDLLTPEQLEAYTTDAQHAEAAVLEDEIAVMKPDISSIEAYRAKAREYARASGIFAR